MIFEEKSDRNQSTIVIILVLVGIISVSAFAIWLFEISRPIPSGEGTKEWIAITPRTGNVSNELVSSEDFYQAKINFSRIEKAEISRSQINHSTIYDSIIKFSNSTDIYFINCIIMFSNITDAYLRNSIVIKSTVSNSIYRNTTFQETKTNNVINLAKTEEKYEENLIVFRIVKSRVCYTIREKIVANIDLNLPYDGFGLIDLSCLENCTIRISNAEAIAILGSKLNNASLIIKNVQSVLIARTYFRNSTVETFNCSEIRLYDICVPAINKYKTITMYLKDTNLKLSDKGIKAVEIKREGEE